MLHPLVKVSARVRQDQEPNQEPLSGSHAVGGRCPSQQKCLPSALLLRPAAGPGLAQPAQSQSPHLKTTPQDSTDTQRKQGETDANTRQKSTSIPAAHSPFPRRTALFSPGHRSEYLCYQKVPVTAPDALRFCHGTLGSFLNLDRKGKQHHDVHGHG